MQQRFFLGDDRIAMVRPDDGGFPVEAQKSDAERWPVAWDQFRDANGDGPTPLDADAETVEDGAGNDPIEAGTFPEGDGATTDPKPPKTKASKK